jgi:carboxylesterase
LSDAVPAVDAGPFDLAGDGPAVLCLHGFTGTPYEMRPLGEACAARGMRAVGPALPGHCVTPQELARTRHEAWLDAAREQLGSLRGEHERVFVAGLSMGGLLALAMAAEGRVDALAVVGTPLALSAPIRLLTPVVKYLHPFPAKRGGSDIRDPAARARHPGYPVMPLAGVHELLRLQRRVRGLLPRVAAPILIAHGAGDRTADPADAAVIEGAVTSSVRERLVLEASGHVVPVDRDGPQLAAAVAAFFGRHA